MKKRPKGMYLTGGTLSSNLRSVAIAVNKNLDVLIYLAEKVEKLEKEVEEIKKGGTE